MSMNDREGIELVRRLMRAAMSPADYAAWERRVREHKNGVGAGAARGNGTLDDLLKAGAKIEIISKESCMWGRR